jgi:positive regulator of sigma E activity
MSSHNLVLVSSPLQTFLGCCRFQKSCGSNGSFHILVNDTTHTVTMEDFEKGIIISQYIYEYLQPSENRTVFDILEFQKGF